MIKPLLLARRISSLPMLTDAERSRNCGQPTGRQFVMILLCLQAVILLLGDP
jgi:hypothetical protein